MGPFISGQVGRAVAERVMPVRIEEMLVREQLITTQQLHEAVSQQKVNGSKVGAHSHRSGLCQGHRLTDVLIQTQALRSCKLMFSS